MDNARGDEPFAAALEYYYATGKSDLVYTRDDGLRDRDEVGWYFTTFADFPNIEKKALKFARGRVLDVGCGAGRHGLYLQRKGLKVVGLEVSPRVATLAAIRGVESVQIGSACAPLQFERGAFQTVLLFGNNLGICGTLPKVRQMLRELRRVTSADGRILATTRMLDATQKVDLEYLARNIALERPVGQVRMRQEARGEVGEWFDLLLFALTDLMQLAAQEGWWVAQVFQGDTIEEGFAVVMEKGNRCVRSGIARPHTVIKKTSFR